ncbi:metal-dependent hydrolase [Burkholderia stabilis]|uniref:cyclase family protein n=1 Tax=Burkholderia stabilis TaxID=95485 RepID=UPI00085169B0|nr:cyclase family protein [Burkholderia stabilis]AOR70337.1 metal-dependent hydrolase [Burkholderia stabilis]HDR9494268.1 cyclase family protein [Burkholderia stabilis]HDR9525609.1 cyclase family protein [Burkholderia stabilis]HDR9531853.1 cyclase family protein [Burkholderia stabilis]HDR9541236.1 cyclase family protein [Burkholderia stabilis]
MESKNVPEMAELLRDAPKNWGKWGPDDEVGSLNYLTETEVLRGVAAVRSGKTFTLQIQMGNPKGDPVWPGRSQACRMNVMDKGHYMCGKGPLFPGLLEYADDMMIMYLQGSTQYDALGHVWYGDQIWNGYDAKSTIGGLAKASVLPIAERGVVGRGVLIDIARHRGKAVLDPGETFTHRDLLEAAEAQRVTIDKRDVLVIRTGWIGSFYERDKNEFYKNFIEPGLTYSPALVEWFQRMEIPNLVTDTIANEVTIDPESGVALPLHNALMRNLGVTLTEIAQLDPLAADCAEDGQWSFLYTAAPLKVVSGSGAPVNPVVIK